MAGCTFPSVSLESSSSFAPDKRPLFFSEISLSANVAEDLYRYNNTDNETSKMPTPTNTISDYTEHKLSQIIAEKAESFLQYVLISPQRAVRMVVLPLG